MAGKAPVSHKTRALFIGFGFRTDSPLHVLYEAVNEDLERTCSVPKLSKSHAPHLTVFRQPTPSEPTVDLRDAASRLLEIGKTLPPLALAANGWKWFLGQRSSLYLAVRQSSEFRDVVAELMRVMGDLLSRRDPYVPHVSFARWLDHPKRALVEARMREASWSAIPFSHFMLDELTLYAKHGGAFRPHTQLLLSS